MKVKVSLFEKEIYKDWLLIIDEVSITPGKVYDSSNKCFLGYVTLTDNPNAEELAESGLVFMLAGISARWKQPVALHYTNNSTNGLLYHPVILEIIRRAHSIGLNVVGIVSDMGSANQALWSKFGIKASRNSTINNKCQHSMDNSRFLYFFHDPAHALKNFKEGMLNHNKIFISDDFIDYFKLPTNYACADHFNDLLVAQNNCGFLSTTFKRWIS